MQTDVWLAALCLDRVSLILLTAWGMVSLAYIGVKCAYANAITAARRRTLRQFASEYSNGRAPKVSIVVALNGQRGVLADSLPAWLGQAYPDFEVIVVDDGESEEDALTLQQLQHRDSRLRVSHLPTSTLYISRKKLAVTLGVRAAKGEWVVLTEPDCRPRSAHWLMNLASRMQRHTDVVVGFCNYADCGTGFCRRARFERLVLQAVYARALLRGKPVGADGGNLAFRRSAFLERGGFSGNVQLLRGEDVFVVDVLARADNVAWAYDSVVATEQLLCSKKGWKNEKIARMQAFRALRPTGRKQLAAYDWSWGVSLLYWLLPWAYVAYGAYSHQYVADYSVARMVLDGCLLADYVILPCVGLVLWQRTARVLGERGFGCYPWVYDALRPWRRLYYELMRLHNRRSLFRH